MQPFSFFFVKDTIMNKSIKLLSTFILLFSMFSVAQASHKMGATMQYSYLGNSKYSIIVKFYRDCRGIPFNNPAMKVSIGSGGNNSCGTTQLTATRLSITDVTQVCTNSAAPCNPVNTAASGYGYEEHVYQTIIDLTQAPFTSLNSSTCPEATFIFSQCCRNAAITTGPGGNNFMVTMTINFANINKMATGSNNSPTFNNRPIIFACCNQSLFLTAGLTDSFEGDSFGFKLVPGQAGNSQSVNYISPFSYTIPVTPYCNPATTINCTPNINTTPVQGFYFNPNSGLMAFTPTNCTEVSIIALEILEYRRDTNGILQHLGTTRKDMQIIVRNDCGYNKAPVINSSNYVYQICEGDSLNFTYTISDTLYTPYQTVSDTTLLSINSDLATTDSITINNRSNKSISSAYFAGQGSARMAPYIYTITVSDDHCPIPSIQSKTILVYISNCNTASTRETPALQAEIYPNPSSNSFTVNFVGAPAGLIIYNSSGQIVSHITNYKSGNILDTHSFVSGMYIVQLYQNGHWINKKLIIQN